MLSLFRFCSVNLKHFSGAQTLFAILNFFKNTVLQLDIEYKLSRYHAVIKLFGSLSVNLLSSSVVQAPLSMSWISMLYIIDIAYYYQCIIIVRSSKSTDLWAYIIKLVCYAFLMLKFFTCAILQRSIKHKQRIIIHKTVLTLLQSFLRTFQNVFVSHCTSRYHHLLQMIFTVSTLSMLMNRQSVNVLFLLNILWLRIWLCFAVCYKCTCI